MSLSYTHTHSRAHSAAHTLTHRYASVHSMCTHRQIPCIPLWSVSAWSLFRRSDAIGRGGTTNTEFRDVNSPLRRKEARAGAQTPTGTPHDGGEKLVVLGNGPKLAFFVRVAASSQGCVRSVIYARALQYVIGVHHCAVSPRAHPYQCSRCHCDIFASSESLSVTQWKL